MIAWDGQNVQSLTFYHNVGWLSGASVPVHFRRHDRGPTAVERGQRGLVLQQLLRQQRVGGQLLEAVLLLLQNALGLHQKQLLLELTFGTVGAASSSTTAHEEATSGPIHAADATQTAVPGGEGIELRVGDSNGRRRGQQLGAALQEDLTTRFLVQLEVIVVFLLK